MSEFDKLIAEISKVNNPIQFLSDFTSKPLTNENKNDIYITLYNLIYESDKIDRWHESMNHAIMLTSPSAKLEELLVNNNGNINDTCGALLDEQNHILLNDLIKTVVEGKSNPYFVQINKLGQNNALFDAIKKYTTNDFIAKLAGIAAKEKTTVFNQAGPLYQAVALTNQKHGITQSTGAILQYFRLSNDDPRSVMAFTTSSRETVKSYGKEVIMKEMLKTIVQLEYNNRVLQANNPSKSSLTSSLVLEGTINNYLEVVLPTIVGNEKSFEELARTSVNYIINNPSLDYNNPDLAQLLSKVDNMNLGYEQNSNIK